MHSMLLLCTMLATAAALDAQAAPPGAAPPPIFAMAEHTSLVRTAHNGSKFEVAVPGGTPFKMLHLRGGTFDRGYQYGFLMADEIVSMMADMDVFYKGEVSKIPWAKLKLPPKLAHALETTLADAAPPVFKAALAWVFAQQKVHLAASPSQPLVEIKGMAAGLCAARASRGPAAAAAACDQLAWETELQRVNELPELIRMSCSMLGAKGLATPSGKLVQLRTLDFGGGPFVNQSGAPRAPHLPRPAASSL